MGSVLRLLGANNLESLRVRKLMLVGVSTRKYKGVYKLYVVSCDVRRSRMCVGTWDRRGSARVLSSETHSCKPCHNASVAAAGGRKGGPVSGRNAVRSGQFQRALELAHTPEAYAKGQATREQKGIGRFTSQAEHTFYSECVRRYGQVDRWRYLRMPGNHSCVDIFIPRYSAYIEVDGIYWHGLDRPYEELEDRIRRKFNRDREMDAFCSAQGIRLFRITDRQVLAGQWDNLFRQIEGVTNVEA